MKLIVAAAAAAACLVAAPALASETLTAVFTTPDGGVTTGTYDGIVDVTVSGVGMSDGTALNDAFYIYTDQSGAPLGTPVNDDYYDLAFGTSTLLTADHGNSINNFIVGPLPAYDASHTYTFQINTGATTPTQLHFGVADDDFADNSGAFTITVAEAGTVPEPATWAVLTIGLFSLGAVARRRRAAVA